MTATPEARRQVKQAFFWTVGATAGLSVVGVALARGFNGMMLPGILFLIGSIVILPCSLFMAFSREGRYTGLGLLLGWGVSLLLLLSICGAPALLSHRH